MKFEEISKFLSDNDIEFACVLNTSKNTKISFIKKIDLLRAKNFLSKLFKSYKIIEEENYIDLNEKRYILIIFKEKGNIDETRDYIKWNNI